MERKRQEAIQREATFSPQLISSKKKRENRATTPGKSRYDMLYADAASRQAQLQRKAHEKEACSFTPKTNWSRKSANGSTPGSGARKGADSPARRSDSLYANAKTLQEKRKSLAENRLREEAKECSFKPQISARAKAKRADSPGPTVRMNQLYEEAKAKEARIAAAQARRELEGCTFQPNINLRRRSSGAAGAPTPSPGAVQERLTRYQKESDRRREQLRQEQLAKEQQELTFQPNIIAAPGASKRPSTPQRAPSQAAIHERLYGEAARQQQQREGGSSAGESSASAKRRAPSPGVFDRLSTPKQPAAQDATREERLAIQELKECTFTPNTRPGSASRARRASAGGSAAGGSGSASGSSTPFWDRLARESEGVREIREEMRKQRELSECTFRPKLNRDASVSSKATNGSESGSSKKSATPIWDRLNEEAKLAKAREEELARKKEADELAACTFKPQISASAQGAKDAKASKPIWDRLADTKALDAKHEALERQREEAALKDCTFMPQTAPPASAASPPTGVKSPKSPPAASSSGAKKGLSYLDRVAAQSKPASASSSSSKPVAPKAGSAVPKVDDSPLVASDSPPVAKDSPLVANGAAKTSAAIKETSNGAVGAPMDDKPNDAVPESTLAAAPAAPAARPAPAQNSGSARLNLEQKIANIMIEAEADDEGNA